MFYGALAITALAAMGQVDLISDPGKWQVGIDSGQTKMVLAPTTDAKLAVSITCDAGPESYPKLTLTFDQPQDWTKYMRVRSRLRLTCDDPAVRGKPVTFVFYDGQTLRTDLPDRPMTQQCIAHTVPVGKWVDLSDWLLNIHRSAIKQVQVYLYELPPGTPHMYRWEIAQLELEGVGEHAMVFDTEVYPIEKMRGAVGKTVGRVRTDDGLELALGSAGEVGEVTVDRGAVGATGRSPLPAPTGLLVRDVTTQAPPVMVGGKVAQQGKDLRQTAKLDALGLKIEATYRSRGPYLEIAGTVADLRGQDRAVTVYFAVPMADAPWQWWDSMAESRTKPDAMAELSNLETGVGYGLNGAHSKYPLGAVTWPEHAGLSLAVRMDEPVVHRLAYNPNLRLFYLALDFGLVPEKRLSGPPLSEAPFRILLYRHDPAWGFRSALQRYYGFFPELFTNRVKKEGGWFVWGDMSKMEGALDAGFLCHWGPAGADAVKWDNAHGTLALQYIEAEFFQQTMGDYDRAPTPEEALDRLRKIVAGDDAELAKFEKLGYASSYAPGLWVKEHSLREMVRTVAKSAEASVNYQGDGQPYGMVGQFPWMAESKWGIIFPCNLDPKIPQGKGWFCSRVYLDTGFREMEAAGAHYDGVGLDSLGGYGQAQRADYRREHFKYASIPLSFSAPERVPVQVAAFATIEWLRELAKEMHDRGMVLMTNCSWGSTPAWLTFGGPYLDIFGAEAPRFADPDYMRAIAYRKPCTDLPYDPRPDWEVAWHLLHGIYPGHGNKVEVMKQFAGQLRELAAAGWEPITGARVEPPTVRLERYGSKGTIYLVAHNPTQEAVQATVQVDAAALGLKAFQAALLPSNEALPATGGKLTVPLGPQATALVALR